MTDSHILIYEDNGQGHLRYCGAWRAHGKNPVGESIGIRIARGLGGFTEEATPQDLIDQLEQNGIRRAEFPSGILPSEEQAVLLRESQDLVRITFKTNGQIEVRWLTTDSDLARAFHEEINPAALASPPQRSN